MKKFIKISVSILSFFVLLIFSFIIYGDLSIPDETDKLGSEIYFKGLYSVSIENNDAHPAFSNNNENSGKTSTNIKLLGAFPVKEISVNSGVRQYVIPGGELVGIRLKTDGVLIVGTECFETENGTADPAKNAGIEVGDTLKSIDDITISTNSQLAELISGCEGESLSVEIERDGQVFEVTLTPEISALTGVYKCGLWIRDSTGGIGTLTYCDLENGTFASLGHGIYDTDTGKLMPTASGKLSDATLSGVRKGTNGTAGELKGSISGEAYGDIISNNENGIYGTVSFFDLNSEALPVAYDSEIKTGYAQIISTVRGNEKEYFDIEIQKINYDSENKNMIIKVTDETLLELTGGIVQGMSGSPIIQNGMLVGAVTHVFVNDPTKGYGITINNMLATESKVITEN